MSDNNPNFRELLIEARDRHVKGDLAAAENLYRSLAERAPGNPEVLSLWGTLSAQRGNFAQAVELIEKSLGIEERQPFALNSLGNALNSLGRYEEALTAFNKLLALQANYPTALNNRGTSLRALRRPQDALSSIDKAIMSNPEYPEAFNNRGLALHDVGRREDALRSYDRAIVLRPDYAEAYKNRGHVLRALKRFDDALKSYDKALSLAPDAGAHHGRSFALAGLSRSAEALADIEKAIALDPDLPYALGQLLVMKGELCDWTALPQLRERLIAAVGRGSLGGAPLSLLHVDCSPDIRRTCAELHVADKYPPRLLAPLKSKRRAGAQPGEKIRIAYLSGEFHSPAAAAFAAGILEHHDKDHFELYAVSFGPRDPGGVRDRVEKACERFADVEAKRDVEVAEALREQQIDIAVDLMGFTAGSRTGILSFRPAPVQVGYYGFPSTMGADYIDYILADEVAIPPDDRAHFSERVVYLPDTYLGAKGPTMPAAPRRADAGLPDGGFVFCSFSSAAKITPEMFDVWMRILRRTEGSVLWLLDGAPGASGNLRREAEKRGVSPQRLVFAPVVAHSMHLARLRLADLLLDTLPYGAQAAASESLCAGVPVLTCLGEGFAGRVTASLLNAAGLPQMATRSVAEYEEKAAALASSPSGLTTLKTMLAQNRKTHPLFDMARLTRNLEAAYVRMVERQRSGQPPTSFAVGGTT